MSKTDAIRIPGYLGHILEALNRIFKYIDDIDEISFLQNTLAQDAVVRNLEVIGEASQNLSRYHQEFVAAHSDVPWEKMYWMRNRLAHGYFTVDFEIVWRTLVNDLPELKQQIQAIYDKFACG